MNTSSSQNSEYNSSGALVHTIQIGKDAVDLERISRADLVLEGIDHSGRSYEGRVYFNNPEANEETGRDPDVGYVGSFTVFGHGGCYGSVGHCDLPEDPAYGDDLREAHALMPFTTTLTVSKALRTILEKGELKSVTIVPCVREVAEGGGRVQSDLLRFQSIRLETYT